ncbi:MAG: membrane protein insertase YidC [Anaerolineales bacterium]|nr:membrane protein insertase YidC [Anaerolineales bacterium]
MNTPKQASTAQPQLPAGSVSGTLKTVLIIALLAYIVLNWNAFIGIFVNVLLWIYALLGHGKDAFGWTIVLFTILIRLATWPLNAQQLKSAQAMQELQNDKEWLDIQKKYAKDREKLAQEQMRIYSERGVSPFASCLPMLIQLPLWFALIQALNRTLAVTPLAMLELARSVYAWPQKFLPSLSVSSIVPLNSQFLWMDLGRPEFTQILGFSVPILVVLVGITSFFQIRLSTPPSPNPNDQSAQMSKSMSFTMPIMMIMMASAYSSGFSLYLLVSNILAIIQAMLQGKADWRNLLPGSSKKPTTPVKK